MFKNVPKLVFSCITYLHVSSLAGQGVLGCIPCECFTPLVPGSLTSPGRARQLPGRETNNHKQIKYKLFS